MSGEGGMADEGARRRLGRGLAALIGDIPSEQPAGREPPRGFRRVPTAANSPSSRSP